jgi:hypothetical protein
MNWCGTGYKLSGTGDQDFCYPVMKFLAEGNIEHLKWNGVGSNTIPLFLLDVTSETF